MEDLEMSENVKAADEKFCSSCGTTIKKEAEICPKCGVRQQNINTGMGVAANGKSRITAALLAFFLGGVGVHRFYLGQTGIGVVYLLFFWTFIPALIAFIDGIVLISMSDQAFDQKYGMM
jgi:TM2 domain-containing membrane protein YozV/ribosomal protein L40E